MRQSLYVFRLVLGAIFIAQYFFGMDGHGRGAGNVMILAFGFAFIGFGIYGLYRSASK